MRQLGFISYKVYDEIFFCMLRCVKKPFQFKEMGNFSI